MQHRRFTFIIFLTGAITLSLELLASRIMTPYFGVSLFIWTGILSITLLSLAIGYFLGGWIANHIISREDKISRLTYYFLAMPSISSISIALASFIYPSVFFQLAQIGLVFGSFLACLIFLLVPLVTLSAMNPLLIALRRESMLQADKSGDGGSGVVFFISTVGSVVGVWATAFIFIPNISNQTSVLLLGAGLSLVTIAGVAKLPSLGKRHLVSALVFATAGLVSNGLISLLANSSSNSNSVVANEYGTWKLVASYPSFFGDLKVLSLRPKANTETTLKLYYQDGLIQGVTNDKGSSLEAYSYILEGLSSAMAQPGQDILILGLAAGIVPKNLTRQGYLVDVVEINPESFKAAADHFMFDESSVTSYQMDARSFVKSCPKKYQVAVVDLFQGDGIPEYLLTQNFFQDLKQCLHKEGVIVVNSFTVPRYSDTSYHLLKTINSEFERIRIFHKEFSQPDKIHSFFIVATNRPGDLTFKLRLAGGEDAPINEIREIFKTNHTVDKDKLAKASIITDEFNTFSILNLDTYMTYRRAALSFVPQEFLVN